MKFEIVTLFPEIIRGFFQDSIMARCVEDGRIGFDTIQIRDSRRTGTGPVMMHHTVEGQGWS